MALHVPQPASHSNIQAACCYVSILAQHHAYVTGACEASGTMPRVAEVSKATYLYVIIVLNGIDPVVVEVGLLCCLFVYSKLPGKLEVHIGSEVWWFFIHSTSYGSCSHVPLSKSWTHWSVRWTPWRATSEGTTELVGVQMSSCNSVPKQRVEYGNWWILH